MTVRYGRGWAVSLLVLGVLSLALYVLGPERARHWGLLAAGAACLVVGTGYLVRPYFTLEEGQVVVHALLTPARRTYPLGPGEVVEEAGRLYVVEGGGRRRIPVHRSLSARADWEAFLGRVRPGA